MVSVARFGQRLVRQLGRRLRWSAEVLGQGKSFRDNPILGSPRLNRLGLHVGRVGLAHAAIALRRAQLAWLVPAALRRAFLDDGFVAIEGFLEPALFERAREEARRYRGEVRECMQGDTATHRVLLDRAARRRMPSIARAVDDPRWLRLMAWASGTGLPPLFYVQQILNGVRPRGPRDPQQILHSDTFHPSVKAWLFLDDVAPSGGPFCYVPGSQRLDLARLRWERARSLDAVGVRDSYSARGSLRLSEEDREALGYPEARVLAVRANTLVLADTHGFHARGHSDVPTARLELFAYSRPSPFLPFVPPPLPGAKEIQDAVLVRWWHHRDARAAARGHLAPWHPVHRESLEGLPDALDRGQSMLR
jgi:hypothetical protein